MLIVFHVLFAASAASTDSCSGLCGYLQGQPGDGVTLECYCDEACVGYGDCCSDYAGTCQTTGSCAGQCDGHDWYAGILAPELCWCDESCLGYGDCCGDYWGECRTGGALRFDGVDDFVEGPPAATAGEAGSSITIEAWVKFDEGPRPYQLPDFRDGVDGGALNEALPGTPEFGARSCRTVWASKGDTGDLEHWFGRVLEPLDMLTWLAADASGTTTLTVWAPTSTWLVAGQWHHLAAVYDATDAEARLYVDGVERQAEPVASPPNVPAGPKRIGATWEPGCTHDGVIDEVRASTRARFPAEPIDIEYALDLDTLALYHFDEGSGTTAVDDSASGANAVVQGATWTTDAPP